MAVNDHDDLRPCYRHPDRLTGVSCSRCGNPICPDCTTMTPVGQRCPDCAGTTRTLRPRTLAASTPIATYTLIAINVFVYVALQKGFSAGFSSVSSSVTRDYGLYGPDISQSHQYYRLLTSAFLHLSLLHIGFNMYALWAFGPVLEQRLGSLRYVLLYLVSGLAGSAGALVLSPHALTVGASGAIFGLMGALFLIARRTGANIGGVGLVIVLNLVLSLRPGISIGGHIGGLIGGIVGAYALERTGVFRRTPSVAALGALGAIAVVSVAIAIGVAGR